MQPVSKTYTKETVRLFWQHARKYPGMFTVFVVGSLLITATDIIQPIINRNMLDAAVSHMPIYGHSARWYVWASCGVAIANIVVWRTMGITNCFFQPRVMSDLYNTCFRYLIRHSHSFFADNLVGSIVTRLNRLPNAFETVDDRLKWNIDISVLNAIVAIIVVFWRLGNIGYLFVGWFVVYTSFACLAAKLKYKPDLASSEQGSVVSGHANDVLSNIGSVQLANAEQHEVEEFEKHTEELYRRRNKSWLLGEYIQIGQGLSILVLNVGSFFYAVGACERGQYTAGDFTMLMMYLWQLSQSLWELGNQIKSVFEALANGNEMVEMLSKPHEIVDAADAVDLALTEGRIVFENVTFEYESDKPVLKNFNLEIAPGEQVALVGESGAGKTTLVQLLLRMHDVTSGRILVDGQDIRTVTLASLRSAMAYVAQSPALFHRSIWKNIIYGNFTAAASQVLEASRLAHAYEFIWQCKRRFGTLVGERGIKLSGGQRQRIAIGRAIVKAARIVIFDEATSALDSDSEARIQDAMHNLMEGKTRLVIAHRLSTIREANRIVVLSGGQIAEIGTHDSLLKIVGGTYRHLWEKQAGGFVLASSPTD